MERVYATARTYTDHGTVTDRSGDNRRQVIELDTAFVRDERFAFSYRDDHHIGFSVWSDFQHTYTQLSRSVMVRDDRTAVRSALAVLRGVSHQSSSMVAALLMPEAVEGSAATGIARMTAGGTSVVDGHACWRIDGRTTNDRRISLWVDRESYLLRRVVWASLDDPRRDTTYAFTPHLNDPVDLAALPPPDLGAQPPVERHAADNAPTLGLAFVESSGTVESVSDDGPATQFGIVAGDIVVAVDGIPLTNSSTLARDVARAAPGRVYDLTIQHEGVSRHEPVVSALPFHRRIELMRANLRGKVAPDFGWLSDLRGSVVVVSFGLPGCTGCEQHDQMLDDLGRTYPALHILRLGTSSADTRVAETYGVVGYPTDVVIDRSGIVQRVVVGIGADLTASVERLQP